MCCVELADMPKTLQRKLILKFNLDHIDAAVKRRIKKTAFIKVRIRANKINNRKL